MPGVRLWRTPSAMRCCALRSEREVAAGFVVGLLLLAVVAGVGGKVGDAAFDHAVLLELVGGEFDLDRFACVDEADVFVADPHFGAQDFAVGHEGHEDGAGADGGADGVGGEVFDDAPARGGRLHLNAQQAGGEVERGDAGELFFPAPGRQNKPLLG
jgi:hypothetical protein